MVNIYLADTGYVNPKFTASETAFSTFTASTEAERQAGEFRADNIVTLKVTSMNAGVSTQNQDTPNINNTLTDLSRLSVSPIKITLTCFLEKQTNYSDSSDIKDISSLRDLYLMTISKGHKDLYVDDTSVAARENLMSIGQLDKEFGREDDGSGTTHRHLNVRVDSISQNENPKTLSYNIGLTLLWDFTDVE